MRAYHRPVKVPGRKLPTLYRLVIGTAFLARTKLLAHRFAVEGYGRNQLRSGYPGIHTLYMLPPIFSLSSSLLRKGK